MEPTNALRQLARPLKRYRPNRVEEKKTFNPKEGHPNSGLRRRWCRRSPLFGSLIHQAFDLLMFFMLQISFFAAAICVLESVPA
jgi:hypothetical protein